MTDCSEYACGSIHCEIYGCQITSPASVTPCRACGGTGELKSTSPTSDEQWTCGSCQGSGREVTADA